MDPDIGLESLMTRYQCGDLLAAAALVNRLSPQLHRSFLIHFVSRPYADDLLQETWIRIHESRHTYRPGHSVLPWVHAIARHVRIDHYRKTRTLQVREQSLTGSADIGYPAAAGASSAPDLAELLAPLPESQREVIAMLKVSGMSLEEVARATSSSIGSVKQKVHRAYEKLREITGIARKEGPLEGRRH